MNPITAIVEPHGSSTAPASVLRKYLGVCFVGRNKLSRAELERLARSAGLYVHHEVASWNVALIEGHLPGNKRTRQHDWAQTMRSAVVTTADFVQWVASRTAGRDSAVALATWSVPNSEFTCQA